MKSNMFFSAVLCLLIALPSAFAQECPSQSSKFIGSDDRTVLQVKSCISENIKKIVSKMEKQVCGEYASGGCQEIVGHRVKLAFVATVHDYARQKLGELIESYGGRTTIPKNMLFVHKTSFGGEIPITEDNVERKTRFSNVYDFIIMRAQKFNLVKASFYPDNSQGRALLYQDAADQIEIKMKIVLDEYSKTLRRIAGFNDMTREAIERVYVKPVFLIIERWLLQKFNTL